MGKSTLVRSEENARRMPNCVVPPRTLAETSCIKTTQATDLIAMIKDISPMRTTSTKKKVADVTLSDESEASDGKLATVMVSTWAEDKVKGPQKGQVMVFLNLSVGVEGSKMQTNHWSDSVVKPAPDCSKTQSLQTKQSELTTPSEANLITTSCTPLAARDVSGLQPLSCAAFLDFTSGEPKARMPEAMQLLWIHLEEPEPSDNVMESSGQRLWYPTKLRDVSGATTVSLPEKQALKLASADTVANFMEKHASGALNMPLLCNARISRTTQTLPQSKSQPSSDEAKVFINHSVEEVDPVSWDTGCVPNASYNDVIHILNNCPSHDEGLVFAFLACHIKPDPFYGFKVMFGEKETNRAK